ncbi:hypothetical protein BpHYR1_010542 [Brachionus plicatilis]|uniref:Uncharacterized protein n=1 Tax=Brachionus plicatilis TaxID=10195 RepID=A0A3M7T8I4_BRAPC|nr:hypothetical protein BpHYR1_010542 [Brachionus plicatilis]
MVPFEQERVVEYELLEDPSRRVQRADVVAKLERGRCHCDHTQKQIQIPFLQDNKNFTFPKNGTQKVTSFDLALELPHNSSLLSLSYYAALGYLLNKYCEPSNVLTVISL